MGTWGAGVFDDDLACEVRDLYRELLAEGYPAEEARDAVLQHWADFVDDVDAGPVIWLALAVTQWKVGRLDEQTRARALAAIHDRSALAAWGEDQRTLRQRRAVLSKVEDQLRSPQPSPRKIRKRYRNACDWERGELVSYRMRSGKMVVFRVVGHHTDQGGTTPVVEVLDWVGAALPSVDELLNCPVRQGKRIEGIGRIPSWTITQLFIGRMSERELPKDRVNRLGIKSPVTQNVGGFGGSSWKTLDEQLADIFGIE